MLVVIGIQAKMKDTAQELTYLLSNQCEDNSEGWDGKAVDYDNGYRRLARMQSTAMQLVTARRKTAVMVTPSLGSRDARGRSTATVTATAGRPRDRPSRREQQRRRLRPLRLVGCKAARQLHWRRRWRRQVGWEAGRRLEQLGGEQCDGHCKGSEVNLHLV